MVARVLIVDDSAVVRRLISQVLDAEPDIELVGTANNGRIALTMLDRLEVDVVVLDVEMPELDGLATLRELRRRPRSPRVIMFSTLTERGASATLEALSLGASDYVTKPVTSALAASLEEVRLALVPRIRALAERGAGRARRADARPGRGGAGAPAEGRPVPPARSLLGSSPVRLASPPPATAAVEVVLIGVSTGGPNALAAVLPQLPADLGVPVLIVQHMPPTFTRLLAGRLDNMSKVTVVEVDQPCPLESGTVYLATGGRHMVARRRGTTITADLNDDPPEQSCRPSVDVLFRSAATVWGRGILAVVLTGMGQDGLIGCRAVRDSGGRVIVQDEATSVVWGMPGHVAQGGLAEQVLPLEDIGPEIARRCSSRPDRRREVVG